MDIKKKLSDTYLTDKDTRKERVIIGLNGGLDSLVAAYLLKIQKYDLIGVTIVNEFPSNSSSFLSCNLSQEKVERIKAFCHQLGISHQVIKPVDDFQENVLDPWIDSKIAGTYSHPCWNCHEMRMKVLYQRMLAASASHIATGHYAKVFRHDTHGSVFLHTSNDETNDQSALLSRLPHVILERLLLPLSDLQKKEVIKLAENFGFMEDNPIVGRKDCFKKDENLESFLKKKIPQRYRLSGDVIEDKEQNKIGSHDGAYVFDYAEAVDLPDEKKNTYFMTHFDHKSKKLVTTSSTDYFMKTRVILKDCQISDETPWQEPFKGAVHFSDGTQVECWIRPKANKRAIIEWEGQHKVIEGDIISTSKKTGKNAKVFLTGVVKYIQEKKVEGDKDVIQTDRNWYF